MRVAFKPEALFKKASKAPKKAAKAADKTKKAVKKAAVKVAGTRASRGWLGGLGGAQNLDKWYGK